MDWAKGLPGALSDLNPQFVALRVLSGLGYGVVRPVFSRTDAMGSLMRRKLEPIMGTLMHHVDRLL